MGLTVGIVARAHITITMGAALMVTPYCQEGEACGVSPTPATLRPPPPTIVHAHFGGPRVRACGGAGGGVRLPFS